MSGYPAMRQQERSCQGAPVDQRRRGPPTDTSANQSAKQVAQSRPVKIGARIGIVAYGVTHLLIAWLALQVAFGQGGEQADQNGAFQALAERALRAGAALGAGHRVRRRGAVAAGAGHLGLQLRVRTTRRTVRKRAVSGAKAAVFLVFAFLAGQTAAGGGGGGGGQQGAAAGVLGLPGGQLLVGAVGLGILAAGGRRRSSRAGSRSSARTWTCRRTSVPGGRGPHRSGRVHRQGHRDRADRDPGGGRRGPVRPEEAAGLDAALKGARRASRSGRSC